MYRLACTILLTACAAESGQAPTACEPDAVLDGSPGAFESSLVRANAGESTELCLELDALDNAEPVMFRAHAQGPIDLALRTLDDVELAAGREAVELELGPGTALFLRLALAVAPPQTSVTTTLSLQLAVN